MQNIHWASPDFDASEISVLIVSNYKHCQELSDALIECNQRSKKKQTIKVHICENVYDIISPIQKKFKKLHIDYIVIVVDTSKVNAVVEVEDNLSSIDESFLMGKLCFVNICCDPEHLRNVSVDELWALQAKYKVPLLNGNIQIAHKRLHLAGRILNLVRISLGSETGFPFLEAIS